MAEWEPGFMVLRDKEAGSYVCYRTDSPDGWVILKITLKNEVKAVRPGALKVRVKDRVEGLSKA
ncbi:hypothetical protein [Candidatus Methylobacter favarea]|nr:hypothetical protein [Candidatus Methylobacter favarea]